MPTATATRNKKGIAPKVGRTAVAKAVHPGTNGSEQATADHNQTGGCGFHLLTTQLRAIPRYELLLRRPDQNSVRGHELAAIKMIDTEAKQLQAISDLYQVLQAQPRSNKLRDSWTVNTPPLEVLTWILKRLGRLSAGNDWSVDTYKDERGKTRYYFAVWRHYHAQKVTGRLEILPLDFLPALLLRDKAAHDLIISTIALVSKCNKIPLWDEDPDFGRALTELLEYPEGTGVIDNLKVQYTQGVAAVYLRLIKRVRRSITPDQLRKQIRSYEAAASSHRKHAMLWSAKNALDCSKYSDSPANYHFIPNFLPGNPIGPNRLFKFIWSGHVNDLVQDWALNRLYRDENSGRWAPVEFSIARPGEVLKPLGEQNKFPLVISHFMDQIVKHFLWSNWKDYYYKEATMKSTLTPGEQLLESIELSELKKRLK